MGDRLGLMSPVPLIASLSHVKACACEFYIIVSLTQLESPGKREPQQKHFPDQISLWPHLCEIVFIDD